MVLPINCTEVQIVLIAGQVGVIVRYTNSFKLYIAPPKSVIFLNGLKCKDFEKP